MPGSLDDQPIAGRVPPETILNAYRDLGGPLPIQSDRTILACDPNFNRYSAYWLKGPTLDTTCAAVETLHALGSSEAQDFLSRNSQEISLRTLGHLDKSGRFRSDSSERTAGIFAFYSAAGIFRTLRDEKNRHQITPFTPSEFETLGKGRSFQPISSLRELLRQSIHPDTGVILDRPGSSIPPSISTLYISASLLWIVYGDSFIDEFFSLFDEDKTRKFISGSIKTYNASGLSIAAFSVNPHFEELCLNTTYFGMRLLEKIGWLDNFVTADILGRIRSFVRLSFRDGGFCSTLHEAPSLNATYFGLKILRLLGQSEDFLQRRRATIRTFVLSCVNATTGGAAFSADTDRFLENSVATWYQTRIRMHLLGEDIQGEDKDRIVQFLIGLYKVGEFSGYPDNRLARFKPANEEWIESYLDERDSRLLATIAGRASGTATVSQTSAHGIPRFGEAMSALAIASFALVMFFPGVLGGYLVTASAAGFFAATLGMISAMTLRSA